MVLSLIRLKHSLALGSGLLAGTPKIALVDGLAKATSETSTQLSEIETMIFSQRPQPNSMSKPAQFSFAADLFMLQAMLKSANGKSHDWQLEYLFPWSCYRQIIEWILNNGPQIGVSEFQGVDVVNESSTHVKIVFPNEHEQDKMHKFFEMFNFKRKQAQGLDRSFPPMPDIYQGESKPNFEVIKRYIYSIENAFDGDTQVVEIPAGANWKFYEFEI